MGTQLFPQPNYAPGLHNASPDELLRMADAEPAPSPLLRALVEALADRVGIEDQLEALQEEVAKERDQWEADEKALRDRLEEADEAADALWGSLKCVMDYAERDVSELEDLACNEEAEAEAAAAREDLNDAYATLQDHPGPTERARREAEEARQAALKSAEAEQRAPGFKSCVGKSARVEYMLPRGRKWHIVGTAYAANLNWLGQCLRQVPERASEVRCVRN